VTNAYDSFFEAQCKIVFGQLSEKLPKHLHYHCLEHTQDVINEAIRIGNSECLNPHEMLILKIAALYHDNGFIRSPHEHEKVSCEIAREQLKNTILSEDDIDEVCLAIMATKIKQSPMNTISEILCDADLDYLGRNDFEEIGHRLFQEIKFSNQNFTKLDWNKLQIGFLESHHFFTKTNIELRTAIKDKHLADLKRWLSLNDISTS
jgi:predicted metal-dependent HD superfamily phosphohydrolase